ncbi:ABC transporter ATP-binding protein [Rhodococcus sp. NPDC058521]|uniref:ABC transporter ATP-binding protein n=1 Tax=Rhodococcus sp. NPDC058521 TaxID=3346536 RepID=UPI003665C845
MASDSAVQIRDLHVIRGHKPVLHGIDVDVGRGSITGLLGPSGCGKTTLMRCIVGTQIIESGTVTVLGRSAGTAPLRNRVGYVTQSPSVYADLTVKQNVGYFGALHDVSKSAVTEAISTVGLTHYATQAAADLSGGQMGRVSLACALVSEPELLVLDEPTVGLDPVLRVELWERFTQLATSGTTLVISSHVMDEADHCDSLLLMRDGRVLAHPTPDELRDRTGEASLEDAFLSLIRTAEQED